MRRHLLNLILALCALVPLGSAAAQASSNAATGGQGSPVTLVNANAAGQQLTRFDVDGNAVDAHDGQIAQFGGTYYLYGTSYDCGYKYLSNSNFCGFKVYSSTDLKHWTDRGYVALPRACQYCFRPHILFNHSTGKYVLWVNDGAAPQGYRTYTNDGPTGLFAEQNFPKLAVSCGVDFSLFEDDDGTAYVIHNDACHGVDMVVERLTPDYLSTDGKYARLHLSNVEAPAMFKRNGIYYITMSDPTCAYCVGGTGTGYMTASSPLGIWHGVPSTFWQVSNGALVVKGGGYGLSADGSSWRDYTFAVDATALAGASTGGHSYAQAGMGFRADDSGNGYGFLLSNYPYSSADVGGYVAFVKLDGGRPSLVSSAALPFKIVAGTAYHVAIKVSGSTFTISVNGTAADTVTDSAYSAGKVGFLENTMDNEGAIFGNVVVSAQDGTLLLSDDFSSGGLSRWAPPTVNKTLIISENSCVGQPSFVSPLTGRHGTIYLYGSDLWNGQRNEATANYYWSPLRFAADGSIQQIDCAPRATVDLAYSRPGHQKPTANLDQSSGVDGFRVTCDIADKKQILQSFTAGRTGTLRDIETTAFQQATSIGGPSPNAPLTMRLVNLRTDGTPGETIAQQTFDTNVVGFSPRKLVMTTGVHVTRGASYAIVLASTTAQGCYGVTVNDENPYRQGHVATSSDDGVTFTAAPDRDLKFLTTVG